MPFLMNHGGVFLFDEMEIFTSHARGNNESQFVRMALKRVIQLHTYSVVLEVRGVCSNEYTYGYVNSCMQRFARCMRVCVCIKRRTRFP